MSSHTPTHARAIRRRLTALGLAALVGASAAAVPAMAQDDGDDSSGGAAAPGRPTVSGASCAAQRAWTCARGQILTLTGDELSGASVVVFLGGAGTRDDVRVKLGARAARSGELLMVVPRRARSGPLRVVSAVGARVQSPRALTVLRRLPGIDEAQGMKALLAGGRRPAVFAYRVSGPVADGAEVEAVRVADGTIVRHWPLEPGDDGNGTIRWDGFAGDMPVRTGTYLLRLDEEGRAAAAPQPGSDTQVRVIEALFPIRGAHTIGRSEMQRFGGARGHQGQDNFARCGTPLAALSKGTVYAAGFQGAAGNHVVVNTPDGGSYAYMHMQHPALVEKGDRVYAGRRLGLVGATGRASECHLHVELWSAPGWYQGGRPLDPFESLLRWDSWS